MRSKLGLLPMVGAFAVVALALPPAPSAAGCTPPYCPSHTLTVKKAGTGSGTVKSFPAGINCGPVCSASFEENTKVTLTASAAFGSTFTRWAGGGCSGSGSCVLTIKAATTVVAIFARPLPPRPPPGRCNKIKLGPVKRRGASVALKVTVPCPGRLVASGRWLKRVRKRVRAAGTVTLRLRLTSAGRDALEDSKSHKLKVKVKVTFTPTGSRPGAKTKKITFRSRRP